MPPAMRRALLTSALCLSACIVQAPTTDGTQATAARPAPAPPVQVPNGANFGDRVELTNVILSPSRLVSGDTLHVSLNFKVLAPITGDWSVFVHIEDVEGRVDRLNADHAPRAKPTSQWKVGETVRDDFDVPVPAGMPVKGLSLLLGLWDPTTDQRMPLRNPGAVKNDGRDRVFVASIPVTQP